jgi:hypothetical protein
MKAAEVFFGIFRIYEVLPELLTPISGTTNIYKEVFRHEHKTSSKTKINTKSRKQTTHNDGMS